MTVKSILEEKGHDVFTVMPIKSIADAAEILAKHRVGALVVTDGEGRIAGILSERDIVRVLAQRGASSLKMTVADAMTATVQVCGEATSIIEVMQIMTRSRFRHVPVERDGRLIGIVSIGDVVKRRIRDAERETEEIKTYIATA